MAEIPTQNDSLALYEYMCQNIVGTKEHVNTCRLMNTVRDNVQSDKQWTVITSGSFGEGLEMRGSDVDLVRVHKDIEVCENTNIHFNPATSYFEMEMNDTHPGYTQLRLVYSFFPIILQSCHRIRSEYYYSNSLHNQRFSKSLFSTFHGPCISDNNELYDIAFCLHCKSWITPANKWKTRSNKSWPETFVKEAIVKHGVLFVPVGSKGSTNEELEWRISFSVGEKLLLYSFTHTQLLCYALLKIFLKDIIDTDTECTELLCSYFMKTMMFWMSEEFSPSIWKPENLISCFMRCFRRLSYYVKYSVCPHYFIPEHNLFENKIKAHAQENLLSKLYLLNTYDWRCILLSDQISSFQEKSFDCTIKSSNFHIHTVKQLTSTNRVKAEDFRSTFSLNAKKLISRILSIESYKIKKMYIYNISKFCLKSNQLPPLDDVLLSNNKYYYKQSNIYITSLMLNTRHDAVSGWLMFASLFYRNKQYNAALCVLKYALSKCTREKLSKIVNFLDIYYEREALLNLPLFKKMSIVQLKKILVLDNVVFVNNSALVPDELKFDVQIMGTFHIPPVVYAHFLMFLCYYHLNKTRHCQKCLRKLQSTVRDRYFISNEYLDAISHNILARSFQFSGYMKLARNAYLESISLEPHKMLNTASWRLSRMR
ncbi:uncharacterized protein [Mytilus edulis]|uniref:uncharacterized protein n=1 Tax=Mytilus edulis TaxID=6550 RepID=UPI0039EE52B0